MRSSEVSTGRGSLPQLKGWSSGTCGCALVRPSPAVVYSPHALAIPLGRQYLYIERLLRKLAGRFIAVSDSEAGDIVHYQLATPDRVSVAYPLIDCDYFTPSANRDTCGGVTGPFTVMGVGRLTAQKDPLRFIAIVRQLQEIMHGVEGVWIGDGELRERFEQLTATGPGPIHWFRGSATSGRSSPLRMYC